MDKAALKKLLDTASGRIPAEMVIKNCKVVDVYNGVVVDGDIAVCGGVIAGVGSYDGLTTVDADGRYATPGFIDSHIHIESSLVTPEEIGRLLVPHGTATIIADPHEIVNVCGLAGLKYMLDAADGTVLDIKFMLPSCVPSTPFEHSGAVVDAAAMEKALDDERILGVGEFMDYHGVVNADESVIDKLLVAWRAGKPIDGHSPAVSGKVLNAYAAARILTDHECATAEEVQARLSRGMYALLRQGSACQDLRNLLKGVTPANSRRCLLCSDDRQPKTIFELGHLDDHLRICVEEGLDPVVAIQMASLNAAECYRLYDRGGIAPGLRADITLLDDLRNFKVRRVFVNGMEAARDGVYLPPVVKHADGPVTGSIHLKDFSVDKLRMRLESDRVYLIGINPGSVVTTKRSAEIKRSASGDFVFDPSRDIAKIAVVERHRLTGNVGLALLEGYGIQRGAVALSIAHDSHNIIVVGVDNGDMALAVEQLAAQNGGVALVKDGRIIESMPLPIGGIMSDQSGEWVDEKLVSIHRKAHDELGVSKAVEPLMTLCFMSLPVIPEVKVTDMGLFDVTSFEFIRVEAD